MRQNRLPSHGVESSEIHYNQTISVTSVNNQQSITITPTSYYDRSLAYKRKNEFTEIPSYRTDKIMRTDIGMVHGPPNDTEYETPVMNISEKQHNYSQINQRQYSSAGNASDGTSTQKRFDRRNVNAANGKFVLLNNIQLCFVPFAIFNSYYLLDANYIIYGSFKILLARCV